MSSESSSYKGTKVKHLTFQQHAKQRSMWLGSPVVSEQEAWVVRNGLIQKATVHYSDAWHKVVDEILVNAVDHYINSIKQTAAKGGPVTEIRVTFDKKTGAISVYNDGQGMPVYREETLDNKYAAEGIITTEYTGSNFDDKGNPDRVTGGINGLGIKLVNVNSSRFELETVDFISKRYYHQVCEDNMEVINEPTVIDLKKEEPAKQFKKLKSRQKKPHTQVTFIPDYKNLEKVSVKKKGKGYDPENGEMYSSVIEARVYQVAAFCASIAYRYDQEDRIEYKKKCKVYFNDTLVKINSLKDFATAHGLCNFVVTELKSSKTSKEQVRFPWSICINVSQAALSGVSAPELPDAKDTGDDSDADDDNYLSDAYEDSMDGLAEKSTSKRSKGGDSASVIESGGTQDIISYHGYEQVNLVNGVYLSRGGSHVNALYTMLEDALRNRIQLLVKKKFISEKTKKPTKIPDMYLRNRLFILNSIQIPIPQFSGQAKDAITLGRSELNAFKKMYTLPKSFVNAIWKLLKPVLEFEFVLNDKDKKKKGVNYIKKYKKAKYSTSKDWKKRLKCGCFVPEGDSAAQTINDIITSKTSGLSYDWYAMYNIQGVPMNALKEIKEIIIGNFSRIKMSKRLETNAGLQGLYQVLGLNYDYHYYTGSDKEKQKEGDAQFHELNYGCMIAAVDQDVDGVGQIFSLLVTYIGVFWPNLIKRGFVKRMASPLIRVYPPGSAAVEEFYSMAAFKQWRKDKFNIDGDVEDAGDIPSTYKVKYYKGLATHSKEEVKHMGDTFEDNLYTYVWDDFARATMEIMHGNDTSLRKAELRTPVTAEYDELLFEEQQVEISKQFKIDTKTFQLDFMERKLPSAIDGLIPSQRKAFCGARAIWANGGKELKVYQLAGDVANKLHYQHGGASMEETITKMAQNFTGANPIPLLRPVSNGFGDRTEGRGKTGAARYIEAQLNKKLTDVMFPRIDDWLLPYAYDDGVQCEPKYYVPIVPYSLLTTYTTVTVGWRILSWARDFHFTLEQVRRMIRGKEAKSFKKKVWIEEGMEIVYGKYGQSSKDEGEICLGDYTWDEETRTVKVTQLPLKVWSYNYKCQLLGVKPNDEKVTENSKTKKRLPHKEFVTDAFDNSGNGIVDMDITLEEGAFEKIEATYGNEHMSSIEDYLELKQNLAHDINMITADGAVEEFAEYKAVLEYWFPVRKQLYEDRMERQILLLKAEIIYYQQIKRFIEMDAKDEINIDKKSEDTQVQLLADAKFITINKTTLFSPKYIKTAELWDAIFELNASFNYIIDGITKRMASKESIKKRDLLIQSLEAQLHHLENTTYKEVWLEELDKLEAVVEEGIKTKWLFGQKQREFKKYSKAGGKSKSKAGKSRSRAKK